MHAAAGLLVSSSVELLAFASRQFCTTIVDLSVRVIHSHFCYCMFFLVSERSRGRRKPPAERIALYIYYI